MTKCCSTSGNHYDVYEYGCCGLVGETNKPPSLKAYDPIEQDELLEIFRDLLQGPTRDGGSKRAVGTKPSWKIDPSHEEAMFRHLERWENGDLVDADSGCHPLVHVAWRALALAWQELNDEAYEQKFYNPQGESII